MNNPPDEFETAAAPLHPNRNDISRHLFELTRLYRLALNGRIRSDEMTRFIYALKEIRACLEAELLTDVQQRLALLSRDMENHNGQRIPHQPAFSRS